MSTTSHKRDTLDELDRPAAADRTAADRTDVSHAAEPSSDEWEDRAGDAASDENDADVEAVGDSDDAADYASYRALSPAAVVACVLGLGSLTAFLDWWLLVLPLCGLVLGIVALRRIAARSDELTGRSLALAGVWLSAAALVASQSWLWYVRLTEVPDGHLRISYADLQPPERSYAPIPDSARDLHGQRVFIKGYVLAGTRKDGIRTFILVRDQGDCCFGGNPKLTDRILVHLKAGHTFTYTNRVQKLAGRFQLKPGLAIDVEGDVIYQLEDAEIL
jgi:hypothetical protein